MHSFKSVLSKMSKVSGSNIFLPFKPLPISMMLKGNAWPGVLFPPRPLVENNSKYGEFKFLRISFKDGDLRVLSKAACIHSS